MLIPCIDLQNGQAVQLVHGRRRELAVADVFGLLDKFRSYKWLHIIDLDAAMNKTPNTKLVRALCTKAARDYKLKVRVGGGIRTLARATSAINAGATQIIVGSSAFKNGGINEKFLATLTKKFGRKKIVVALDTAKGQILTQGWREKLKLHPSAVIPSTRALLLDIPLHRRRSRRHHDRRKSPLLPRTPLRHEACRSSPPAESRPVAKSPPSKK